MQKIGAATPNRIGFMCVAQHAIVARAGRKTVVGTAVRQTFQRFRDGKPMMHSTPHFRVQPPFRAFFPCVRLAFLIAGVCLLAFLGGCSSNSKFYVPERGSERGLGMIHIVSKNEWLAGIARYYQRDLDLLTCLNRLENPDKLHPGQAIYIPPDNSMRVVHDGRITLDQIDAQRRRYGAPPPLLLAHDTRKTAAAKKKPSPNAVASSAAQGAGVRSAPASSHKRATSSKRVVNLPKPTPPPPPKGRRDYIWPLDGQYVRGFSSSLLAKPHMGVDIAAPLGHPIRAARRGTVLFSGSNDAMRAYGKLLILDHGDGFCSLYAHCSELLARTGERVDAGQVIARVGRTGRATGNHLHFEIRYEGVAVDPEQYLSPFGGERAIAAGN